MTRPCRPCAAYAATAAHYDLPEHIVPSGRFRVAWPPRRLRSVFPQCRPATVETCKWHANGVWPISLYMALAVETFDATMPTVAPLSALDDLIRAKAAGFVAKSKRMYGAWPGEDVAAVLAAYRETRGNASAAGRLLDKRGVPTRGGAPWQPSMVAWIVTLQG
jgi:hypothetical protein